MPGEVNHETSPDPKTFYAISKMRGEQHIERLQKKGFNAKIVRCANVFGYSTSMRFDSVINRFMFDAHFARKIAIHGDGEQYRSFIHIDRAVNVLANMMSGNLAAGAYDLVGANYSINTIADSIKEMYPGLEMIFMDQVMIRSNLKVKPDERLDSLCKLRMQNKMECGLHTELAQEEK